MAAERLAVIDLGPDAADASVRQRLAKVIVAAGFDAVIGDGVEDALAGQSADRDAVELAAAMAEAQRAFGALDCAGTIKAATTVLGISAARQAAGLAIPEAARASAYVLLCADRSGDVDGAMIAAARVHRLGAVAELPPDVLAKYPEVDTVIDRELVPLEITADAPNASIWIDFERAGTSPVKAMLPAGTHVIAAATKARRGWAAGTAIASQSKLEIPTRKQAGASSEIATRVAGWGGKLPSPDELGWVLGKVGARAAVIRSGDTLEVWGRSGRAEVPVRLGGEDGMGKLDEIDRLIALIGNRVSAWNDRAPDPDKPLLVEDPGVSARDRRDPPTRWWVYASLLGAAAAAGVVLYLNDAGDDRQRVELHFPRVQP